MELNYNGVTLPSDMIGYLVKVAKSLNVPPSYLITKLHFEGIWGKSEVARENNNWSGMTWTGDPNRPSGIVVSKGSARPKNEGGHYMRYKSVDEFLTDWTYLIRRGGIYKVADSATFDEAVKGMFKVGGAKYDYAASGFDHYSKGMKARRQAINRANNGALDKLDNAKGLIKGVSKTVTVTAKQVLDVARGLIGATKYGATHKKLINDYNKVTPRPVSYAVKYDDDWCDAFVTVVADRAGATSLIGRECGVERHKSIFKQKNIWLGLVKPQAGDIVIWRWDGNRNGFANHIGFVESVSGNTITTIEGNTFKGGVSQVGRNTYAWNAQSIQGYARPKYGTTKVTPEATAKNENKVSKHFVVTIDNLRAFQEPTATSKLVENIKRDYVKNIDVTVESEGYLWGGWISSADGKRRYTTLQTLDGKRKFVDLKDGTISHGGETYTEYLALQEKVSDDQPVGGDTPKVGKGQVEIDGTVYDVELKETK
ncbi:CHAP domain-containing protein [Ruoffia tabacinasalis]|uniref:CHAP domain-containing protein n=1 Tax=Ruoffia tabacinasalis TaxID=87458 RepID=A0ABS0LHZ2_9LACT|nr:CHAP domain-containing protein [Ruoffia tabacinasalis]